MSRRAAQFFVLSALVLAAAPVFAKGSRVLTGKVVAVLDGDTITVLDEDQTQHKIRLYGIHAPKKKQPFGAKAREALAAKVVGKEVEIVGKNVDRDGSDLGYVYVSGPRLINLDMVLEGFAWRSPQDDKRGGFTEAEKHAREHKRGLWADPHPIPPWEFK